MNYKMAYQNAGGPMSWKHGPPVQSRAADAVSLGSLGDPTLVLPVPGGPEPLNYTMVPMSGCGGCKGKRKAMSGVSDTIAGLSTPVKVGGALLLAYLLHKHLKKK